MSVLSTQDISSPLAVIDMGSNGIRFGIVSELARHLPVTYEERAPISLFDAQGEERIIPEDTIEQVLVSFRRFQKICEEANVEQPNNVKVIATEATRLAGNAQEFLSRIYETTGWTVYLLSKEEEAMISAAGIVGNKEYSYVLWVVANDDVNARNLLQSGWFNNGSWRGFL